MPAAAFWIGDGPSVPCGDIARCNKGCNPPYHHGLGQEWRVTLIRHDDDFELTTSSAASCRLRAVKSASEPMTSPPTRNCIRLAKTCSKSPSLLAFSTWRLRPSVRAAACEARATGSATVGLAGLMRSPTTVAAG